MDRTVLLRLAPPALLLAGPPPTFHGPRGQVHHLAVQPDRADDHAAWRDLEGEVQGDDEAAQVAAGIGVRNMPSSSLG